MRSAPSDDSTSGSFGSELNFSTSRLADHANIGPIKVEKHFMSETNSYCVNVLRLMCVIYELFKAYNSSKILM